jgi:mannose-6-phosphate isomerase-like protein (cupin superfamily)
LSLREVATSTLVAAPWAIVLNRIGAPLIVWVVPAVFAAARNREPEARMRYWALVIARRWTGRTAGEEQAGAYISHFERTVRPRLENVDGFLGATVERVDGQEGIEIVVVTRWASMDAVRAFAGDEVDLAVVEPEARAILTSYDPRVRHVELADGQRFGPLERIDIPVEAAAHRPWFNETLVSINDAVVRLGVIEGDFHWHRNDDQDEFFLVVEGELLIDLAAGDTIALGQHQACSIPKGVVHRTRAPRRTTILMVEAAGVMPVGD